MANSEKKNKGLISFLLCPEGTTAVEFAVIAPVLVFIICVEFAFGLTMFETSSLQGAITNAARAGAIGIPDTSDNGASGKIRWTYVTKNVLYSQTGPLFDSKKLTFTVTAYNNYADAIAGVSGTANSLGTANQVVVYKASYPFVPMPFIKQLFDSSYAITAYAIVKNEPF